MALLETKVLQVENDQETITDTSNLMGSFGWTVLSVQVTHSQNTKTYGMTDINTVETTTINYATMTMQRDKHMPNYAEIARLEDEYNQAEQAVRGLAAETRTLEAKQYNSKYTPLLIVLALLVFYRGVVDVLTATLGVGITSVLVFLVDAFFVVTLGYSAVHFFLTKYAKNEELRQRIEKMPKTVFGFLNRDGKSKKEIRSERLEEVERLRGENVRRMAEARQQAESLLA